jgi:hypothetical protein
MSGRDGDYGYGFTIYQKDAMAIVASFLFASREEAEEAQSLMGRIIDLSISYTSHASRDPVRKTIPREETIKRTLSADPEA